MFYGQSYGNRSSHSIGVIFDELPSGRQILHNYFDYEMELGRFFIDSRATKETSSRVILVFK